MKFYNTLTNEKEQFKTIEENKVKMYVCGPTVYDFIHIGNARPLVVFDTLRRYFLYRGIDVCYVQNFTDIDDKIINRANDENVDSSIISNRYIEEFMKDAKSLNVLEASHYPKVTEEVENILIMIDELIQKGYAYEVNGTVYFNTRKHNEYGKLSNRNLDDLLAGARVEIANDKQNSTDFVLWKPAKPNEPSWESKFGLGRPGWHIECSVMAKKYLGNTIDIHAGGEDLIFPHHENEIAQSECANGKPFANYWLHNGFINIDNEKMSKSLGNFFTVRDILQKFDASVVRFFILSGHYRSPINFSDELMLSAKNGLDRIKKCYDNLKFLLQNNELNLLDEEKSLLDELKNFKSNFDEKMDDDFNTADAISVIFDLVKFINLNITEKNSKQLIETFIKQIDEFLYVIGINFEKEIDKSLEEEVLKLIEERTTAKRERNFNRADEIRDYLLNKGVVLEDTRNGVKWSYKG